METKIFLEGILPSEGVFVAATPTETGGFIHTPCENISELTRKVLTTDQSNRNSFFALASYKQGFYIDERTQKKRCRTQENAQYIKCLFLDIDCSGGDKHYDNHRDGLLALHKFIKEYGIPKPTYIINSGGGVHVYWTFDKHVTTKQWQPVANALKLLHTDAGLKADPVTADSARILRPVGTHNHKKKYGQPRAVTILKRGNPHKFSDIAKAILVTAKQKKLKAKKPTPRNKVEKTEFPPADAHAIAEKCNAIRAMRDSKGANQSELEWYNSLGILRHTTQGEAICQEWSSEHPEYDEVSTREKMQQWGHMGATSCETMRSVCDDCKGCTLKCNSPIVLGFPEPEHQTEIMFTDVSTDGTFDALDVDMPEPTTKVEILPEIPDELHGKYAWQEGKGLMASGEDADGNRIWFPICSQFPVPDFIFWDDHSEQYIVRVKSRIKPFQWLEGDIPMETIQKGGINLIGALGGKCAVTVTDDGKHLVRFMKTWVDSIRQNTNLVDMCDQMGWQSDGSFLLGNTLYNTDGTQSDVVVSRSLTHYATAHQPKGELNRFVEIINHLYNRPNHEHYQFFWLASFASPIVKLIHTHNIGITLSAWSKDSGTGKTSVCKAGIANFGDPSGFGQTADGEGGATEYAMYTMAGLRHNLPILVDETTEWTPQKLGGFVYRFSNGTGKLQGKADGGLRDTAKLNWNSICYLTSNTPCAQSLMAHKRNCQAQLARVFDIKFKSTSLDTQDSALFEELWQHTGNTGSEFIKYVVANQEKVRTLSRKHLEMLNKKAQLEQDARFWAMFCASVMTSAKITKVLGLHDFDLEALEAWVVKKLRQMNAMSKTTIEEADDTLRDMLADMQSGMIVTQKAPIQRGEVTPFAIGYGAPRTSVTGRYIVETGDVYIPIGNVRKWCAEQNVDILDLATKLEAKKWLRDKGIRYDIGRGTNVTSTRSRCWHLNYENTATLLDVIQSEDAKTA